MFNDEIRKTNEFIHGVGVTFLNLGLDLALWSTLDNIKCVREDPSLLPMKTISQMFAVNHAIG